MQEEQPLQVTAHQAPRPSMSPSRIQSSVSCRPSGCRPVEGSGPGQPAAARPVLQLQSAWAAARVHERALRAGPVVQVARCTKIINPGTDDAKYLINVKQIAKASWHRMCASAPVTLSLATCASTVKGMRSARIQRNTWDGDQGDRRALCRAVCGGARRQGGAHRHRGKHARRVRASLHISQWPVMGTSRGSYCSTIIVRPSWRCDGAMVAAGEPQGGPDQVPDPDPAAPKDRPHGGAPPAVWCRGLRAEDPILYKAVIPGRYGDRLMQELVPSDCAANDCSRAQWQLRRTSCLWTRYIWWDAGHR